MAQKITAQWIVIGFLALPIAELAVFALVANAVGFGTALLLVVLSSVIGAMLMKQAGRAGLEELRRSMRAERDFAPGPVIATASAGLLLFIPGFLTDVLGVLMLMPSFRRWLAPRLQHRTPDGERRTGPAVIDLEPGEWHAVRGPKRPEREP